MEAKLGATQKIYHPDRARGVEKSVTKKEMGERGCNQNSDVTH